MISTLLVNFATAQPADRFSAFAPLTTRLETLVHRVSIAVSTMPQPDHWLQVAGLVLIYTLISLPLGFKLGLLQVDIETSWVTVMGVMVTCLFSPAITEEVFFRVLLLPHPTENASAVTLWLWGGASLGLFIAYHPLNAMTFFPAGRQTFSTPGFLLLATLLGVICAIAYLQSGSLWLPVLIHWLTVTIWLLVFGGYKRLYG